MKAIAQAPQLLTPYQVAARVGLSVSTLAKMRLKGGGPSYVKLGASVRYAEDTLASWIADQPRYTSTAASSVARQRLGSQSRRS